MTDLLPGLLPGEGVSRRGLLGLAATVGLGATAAPFPDGATLLVGGPGGGAIDGWAEWLTPSLGHGLAPGTTMRKDVVGGEDGVTAANQFEARAVPDGGTALLLPGSAAMAWLVGDPRAHFDAARWVPALAGVTPGLVVARSPHLATGSSLRIAAGVPGGSELPALLALDLMGAEWAPVYHLSGEAAASALAQGQVDAICLHGRRVPNLAEHLASAGFAPAFTFGVVDATGQRQRDPDFPDTPTAAELFSPTAGAKLQAAWSATAAAAELEVALVLPQLTPAAMVALWRRACAQAVGTVQAQAAAVGVRTQPSPAATASTNAVLVEQPVLLELRSWLASRLNYRPA